MERFFEVIRLRIFLKKFISVGIASLFTFGVVGNLAGTSEIEDKFCLEFCQCKVGKTTRFKIFVLVLFFIVWPLVINLISAIKSSLKRGNEERKHEENFVPKRIADDGCIDRCMSTDFGTFPVSLKYMLTILGGSLVGVTARMFGKKLSDFCNLDEVKLANNSHPLMADHLKLAHYRLNRVKRRLKLYRIRYRDKPTKESELTKGND